MQSPDVFRCFLCWLQCRQDSSTIEKQFLLRLPGRKDQVVVLNATKNLSNFFANRFEMQIFVLFWWLFSNNTKKRNLPLVSCLWSRWYSNENWPQNLKEEALNAARESKSGYNEHGATFTQALFDLLCQGVINIYKEYQEYFNLLIRLEIEKNRQKPSIFALHTPFSEFRFSFNWTW